MPKHHSTSPRSFISKRSRNARRDDYDCTATDRKGRRAKRMAAEGAYRKAASGLVSDMMFFTPQEDLGWAAKMLPRSENSTTCFSTEGRNRADIVQLEEAIQLDSDDGPLKGVRYGTMTAPGPSGTRPEHIKDLLAANLLRIWWPMPLQPIVTFHAFMPGSLLNLKLFSCGGRLCQAAAPTTLALCHLARRGSSVHHLLGNRLLRLRRAWRRSMASR